MNETVAQADLILLAKANKVLSDAQAAMQFVTAHFIDTYKLGPNDSVNPTTGEITRNEDTKAI